MPSKRSLPPSSSSSASYESSPSSSPSSSSSSSASAGGGTKRKRAKALPASSPEPDNEHDEREDQRGKEESVDQDRLPSTRNLDRGTSSPYATRSRGNGSGGVGGGGGGRGNRSITGSPSLNSGPSPSKRLVRAASRRLIAFQKEQDQVEDQDQDLDLDDDVSGWPARGRRSGGSIRRKKGIHPLIDDEDDEEEGEEVQQGRKGRRGSEEGDGEKVGRRGQIKRGQSEEGGTGGEGGEGGEEEEEEQEEEEDEEDEETKKSKLAKKEEEEMIARWMEEYFEIVEQLPLELHRSFALMRELEAQMQGRLMAVCSGAKRYRDSRAALKVWAAYHASTGHRAAWEEKGKGKENETAGSMGKAPETTDGHLGGEQTVQEGPSTVPFQAGETTTAKLDAAQDVAELSSAVDSYADPSPTPPKPPPSRAQRLALLRAIAASSSEAVRAAEEKVGLAVTAYNWVDRHIRRLDADLQKSESSLLLGLRSGTEESRGVREALGMNVDNGTEKVVGLFEASTSPASARGSRRMSTASAVSDRSGNPAGGGGGIVAPPPVVNQSKAQARGNRTVRRRGSSAASAAGPNLGKSTSQGRGAASAPAGADKPLKDAPLAARGRVVGGRGSGRGWRAGVRGGWRSQPGRAHLAGEDQAVTSSPSVLAGSGALAGVVTVPTSPNPDATATLAGSAATAANTIPGTLVPDMAIDPNEPRYCYCDQVSFGDMVACDNDDCSREWFHYGCIGISQPPKGKWYCLFCAPPGWKGPGMSIPPGAVHVPKGHAKEARAKK